MRELVCLANLFRLCADLLLIQSVNVDTKCHMVHELRGNRLLTIQLKAPLQ